MLLKFKNKYLMALDRLIKEGEEKGLIESIVLEQKEAMGLILEIIKLGAKYTKDIVILDTEGVDITRAELIWRSEGLDKNEHVKSLVNRWYKIQCAVTYKDIPLSVINPIKVKETEMETGWTASQEKPDTDIVAPKFTTTTESFKPRDLTVNEKSQRKEDLDSIINSWKLYDDIPEPPKPPLNRRILSFSFEGGICKNCGSSLKSKWFGIRKPDGCIHPECENYWKNKK